MKTLDVVTARDNRVDGDDFPTGVRHDCERSVETVVRPTVIAGQNFRDPGFGQLERDVCVARFNDAFALFGHSVGDRRDVAAIDDVIPSFSAANGEHARIQIPCVPTQGLIFV